MKTIKVEITLPPSKTYSDLYPALRSLGVDLYRRTDGTLVGRPHVRNVVTPIHCRACTPMPGSVA